MPINDPLIIIPDSNSDIKSFPKSCATIIDGIVTLPPSAPPAILTADPGTLFTMITATAPSACADNTLKPNSHVPLLITAILPAISLPFVMVSQAS